MSKLRSGTRRVRAPRSAWARTAIYACLGFGADASFSAAHDIARRNAVRLRTSAWMLPIYALITPLFEPLHDSMRGRVRAPTRAAVYGAGFLTMEYVTGATLRRLHGSAPWDYSYARMHLHGLIRPDYFFLWSAAGLALERLHDSLTNKE